jgi:peptidyl-prolyl cis-trans isomerase B (cyclophilin B)
LEKVFLIDMTTKAFITGLLFFYTVTGFCQKKDHVVTIKTKFGDMVAILYDETPKHKANFIKLAQQHFYDSLIFHRIIEGFMIQGGDPESKKAGPGQRLGNGGPGYNVDAEINPKFFHEKGALSAARLSDGVNPTKASSGSQFYVVQGKTMSANEVKIDPQRFNMAMQQFFQKPENKAYYDTIAQLYQTRDAKAYEAYIGRLKPIVEKQLGTKVEKDVSPEMLQAYTTVGGTPMLDGQYTVFGKVIKGLEVIDKIATQPKDQADRPTEDIRMTVTVEELPKSKIEKLYGYKYPAEIKK